MKDLQSILFGVSLREVVGSTQVQVADIQIDSRKVSINGVFVAIKGVQVDGHTFIATAIEKGATVIVCEQLPETIHDKITYLVVANASEAVAIMAHQFYDAPSHIPLVNQDRRYTIPKR